MAATIGEINEGRNLESLWEKQTTEIRSCKKGCLN